MNHLDFIEYSPCALRFYLSGLYVGYFVFSDTSPNLMGINIINILCERALTTVFGIINLIITSLMFDNVISERLLGGSSLITGGGGPSA